ncbi:MAG: UbiA family prenyltransferase [Ketobacter sp.]|nr:MAG: UbiA family prenyltransferase [Ketobacter sp.]
MSTGAYPLVVDLDGTLIRSDLLIESFLMLIKDNPFNLILVLCWLVKGKAHLKAEIAKRVDIPVDLLPYNQDVLDYLAQEKAKGREIVLATASNERYAKAISDHLTIFDSVFASNDHLNLSGRNKRSALTKRYGERQYSYVGNEQIDLEVWQHTHSAVVVGDSKLTLAAEMLCTIEKHIPLEKPGIRTFVKALRVHQWVKNGLILVPLLTSHNIESIPLIFAGIVAFIAFSLCASSVYLLNDMLDLFDDRQHATKKERPFAKGTLPLLTGLIASPALLLIAIVLCVFLPIEFLAVLAVYYLLTLAYSFKLKRLVMVDVITLASLYTIRILAGAAAVGVTLSFWLLSFSMFLFLSLAIVKRYTELLKLRSKKATKTLGRGYQVQDAELLAPLGGASGYISVLVLALYINSPDVKSLYSQPELMWPACLVMLYWVSRIWIIAHRGNMNDDPIVFALKDMASIICVLLIMAFMIIAV